MKNSKIVAAGLSVAIVVWMAAGLVFSSAEDNPDKLDPSDTKTSSADDIVVETRDQDAQPVTSYIVTQGTVFPDREVTLRAETAGRVDQTFLAEGSTVRKSDLILKLETGDRDARLQEAKAKIAEANRKYESAKSLGAKGYSSQSRTDETLAALKTAQAEAKQIRLEIENTEVRAPFDGVIDKRALGVGDYVSIGTEMLTIVDNDPLVVRVSVPQQDVSSIQNGDRAQVTLATGHGVEGVIRFIAPRAEAATKTFRVDIELPNPGDVPSGVSATARIPKQTTLAHRVSPALLVLGEDGAMGIKTVTDEGVVNFHTVSIVRSEPDGIYVSGLPEHARVITAGQGFVSEGQKVSFVPAGESQTTRLTGDVDADLPAVNRR